MLYQLKRKIEGINGLLFSVNAFSEGDRGFKKRKEVGNA
jgi:hypothetical protein